MLRSRLVDGSLLIAGFVAAVLWAHGWGALGVIGLATGMVQWELYKLLDRAGIPNFRILGLASGQVVLWTTWVDVTRGMSSAGDVWVVHAWFFIMFAVLVRQFWQKNNPRPLETVAGTWMGVLYAAWPMSYLVRLLLGWEAQPDSRLLIVYLVALIKLCDTAAYFVGCAWGRHKLFPRISPAKSWEGAAAAVIAGGGISPILISLLRQTSMWPGGIHISVPEAAAMGVGLAIVGIVGDLAESLLKRAAEVKDSGSWLKGLGGWLDVLDSILPAAPVLYIWLRYWIASGT